MKISVFLKQQLFNGMEQQSTSDSVKRFSFVAPNNSRSSIAIPALSRMLRVIPTRTVYSAASKVSSDTKGLLDSASSPMAND